MEALHYLNVVAVGAGRVHLHPSYVTSNGSFLRGDALTSQSYSLIPKADTWGCKRSEKGINIWTETR